MEIPLIDLESEMSLLERVTIEGLLAHIRPAISIELGTSLGASLRQITSWSNRVHTFDLTLKVDPHDYDNVEFHIGDSHKLLSPLLSALQHESQTVQFVLVDADHSPAGVRQDLIDLLESPAIAYCLVALHDTANERVRRGIESVPLHEYGKIAWMDLDFVPSRKQPQRLAEAWGGLGLILMDVSHEGAGAAPAPLPPAHNPFRHARDWLARTRRLGGALRRRLTP
jgi:hypothetical protein